MKTIIFGGNGFLGKHLVDELTRKAKAVLVCDISDGAVNAKAPYIRTDIRDKSSVAAVPFARDDIIINLAANQYHHRVPRINRQQFFFETNTRGTENILEVAFSKGCKNAVQFTTDMTYGKPLYLPVDTKHPQNPIGPYGRSKKAAEEICRAYRKKGMNITVFRPRMIIGPGRLGILKRMFTLIEHNLPIPTIGNGKNCYQMISVFDCVSAIELAIHKGVPNKEYNLGSNKPPQIRDLLQSLVRSVGSSSRIVPTSGAMVKTILRFMGLVGLEIMYREQYMIADQNYILDISETEAGLGWSPRYSDQEMMREAYKAWKARIQ